MKNKFKKVLNYIIRDIKYNYKSYLIFILVVPWFFIKLDYYVYSSGGLIPLEDRVEIENGYESKGSFNMTYVSAKNGTIPIILLSYIIPSWDLVSIDESRIENESGEDIILRNQLALKSTSYDAVIAAFDEANIDYNIISDDLTVSFIDEKASTNVKLGDVIKTVNNEKVTTFDNLVATLQNYKENDRINITVSRNNKIVECYSILRKEDNRILIGIMLESIKVIETTPKVNYIFKDSESGSSRGLMCALEIYDKLIEYDLTKGDTIAGTGTIDENGIVGAISGIKYKLSGAVKKKADVFIVPTENYEEAINLKKDKNYNIEIIEADNLHNVIDKLMNR